MPFELHWNFLPFLAAIFQHFAKFFVKEIFAVQGILILFLENN